MSFIINIGHCFVKIKETAFKMEFLEAQKGETSNTCTTPCSLHNQQKEGR